MRTTKALLLSFLLLGAARTASAVDTVVTLSFDDTFADQAQVGALLSARAMKATFFVNNPRLDQVGYMTTAEVMALQSAGNEIGGHTAHHNTLTGIPADEAKRQICDDRAGLLARGLNVTNFAYPKGAEDPSLAALVVECGYNAARDVASLRSHGPETCVSCAYAESMPPANMMAIRTPVSIKSTNTLADLQLSVTDAETHGGGWVPFVFHHVCDGCSPNAISPAVLTQFLDWLAARSATGTVVKTFQDVVAGPLNPAVTAAAAIPYVGNANNQLRNASLEDDVNTDLTPDCWAIGSGGAADTTFTVTDTATAHSGTHALQISVVAGMTASPRVITFQDLGACAPPMKPGETFKVSAYYLSSDAPRFIAYYRNSAGAWKYYAQSPPLAAVAEYTLGEWTTPAAPADSTGFSVGIAVDNTGTLYVDDLFAANTAGPPAVPTPDVDGGTPVGDGGVIGGDVDGGTNGGGDVDGGTNGGGTDDGGCAMAPGAAAGGPAAVSLFAMMAALWATRRRRY